MYAHSPGWGIRWRLAVCRPFYLFVPELGLHRGAGSLWLWWTGDPLSMQRAGSRCGASCVCRAQALGPLSFSTGGSQALEHGLSSGGAWAHGSAAWRVFPDQGSKPCLLHWQVDSEPPGKFSFFFYFVTFISHSEVGLLK